MRQIAAVITVVVFALAVVFIPDMSVISRVALLAVAAVFGVVVIFESRSFSRRRRDHLRFELDAPPQSVAGSVRTFLELNRISNSVPRESSVFGAEKGDPNVICLESWGATLTIRAAEGHGENGSVSITVGPVGPDTETLLKKMMADLKRELEREFLSRAA